MPFANDRTVRVASALQCPIWIGCHGNNVGFSTCSSDVVYQHGTVCRETADEQKLTFHFLLAVSRPCCSMLIGKCAFFQTYCFFISVLMTSASVILQ